MLRSLRSRRRPRYGAQLCAVISALLLLLSVSLLYGRLSYHTHQPYLVHSGKDSDSATNIHQNPLLSDSEENQNDDVTDKIDELDTFEEQKDITGFRNDDDESAEGDTVRKTGYFMDHTTGTIRRALNKRSIEEWDYESNSFNLGSGVEDQSKAKAVFASDDIPIDEDVRRKVSEVEGIEDALLLKVGKRVSPLRIGWGDWFDKKGDFLRRDKMFKSNLEVLNPLSNPLLQDPDGVGVTGLTRGDKAVQKLLLSEFKRTPFLVKSPARVLKEENSIRNGNRAGIKMAERRIFDENVRNDLNSRENGNAITESAIKSIVDADLSNGDSKVQQRQSEELNSIYADGKRWGYFPGLQRHLSFSEFVDSFFRKGECLMRVFMVWNSPPWMYTVRQQRGLESLLQHHKDACVVILSETIELDFFAKSFVKDGYKVAVAMPNLEELLKDTPASIFADVWFDWRKTKYYSTHYSELVRLAALYKYGGIYLDSDVVVLNPLSSLNNTVGLEGQLAKSSLNGAVMAFTKNSVFILECLREFYMTYDDTRLRWNGADLLARVARNFLGKEAKSSKQRELKLLPSYIFFPIASQDITSYFTAPATETEKAHQDGLYDKILKESLTFHFWNSLTSALIPEPGSLVARLIDSFCIRCTDVL